MDKTAAGIAKPPSGTAPQRATSEVPFAPAGRIMPIFFLHIPKTSGSSVNAFLKALYGEDNFIEHAEYKLPHLLSGRLPTMVCDCVSAHIPLFAWHLYPETAVYRRVTLLREPWERLVSHVNWINRFNHDKELPTVGPKAAPLKHVSAVLRETDFGDEASIRRLFDEANAQVQFTDWDNLQVRMLLTGNMQAMTKPLGEADAENALGNLAQFFVYGFCENNGGFQADLVRALGRDDSIGEVRENPGAMQVLKADNTLAREIFAPWIEWDRQLYDRAQKIARQRRGG